MDFLIGLFAANAIPHFVFGRLDAGVLGLFGYSGQGNVIYSIVCVAISLLLFHIQHGLTNFADHMILVGVLTIVASYWIGWPVIMRFLKRPNQSDSSSDRDHV
ncbi:hypothetical protein AB1L42_04640 [Thalassoglobus sp. JC818]|uniref:hypothetical protein n=1 Tax=Thalassoglobus sp. JC818 TaxID=3232136 RepID=UPI00345B19B8